MASALSFVLVTLITSASTNANVNADGILVSPTFILDKSQYAQSVLNLLRTLLKIMTYLLESLAANSTGS
ncbi:hypothetical protein L596_016408 [Steinernema carpocapsae]|uniref:Uncharacterized protein n=1 Tax=Steinernema carpocapsae TaxID=34508 RepID=A0A4U5NHW3_STECR|nr:hypothetical protein L596_016408 [Steinernema carpocapsae]